MIIACTWKCLRLILTKHSFVSGELLLIESPDREAKSSYKVKVQARILAEEEDKAVPVLFYTLYLNDAKKKQSLGEMFQILYSSCSLVCVLVMGYFRDNI